MTSDPRNVKSLDLNEDILEALESVLSPERLATYAQAVGGERALAIRLYTWNTAVSAAFYGPLQGLEVALRNAMNRRLADRYGRDWYDNPAAGLDDGCLRRVAQAKRGMARDGYPVDPPHIVAALSFGFWVSLLGPGGQLPAATGGKANYEMTLWRPALRGAFPYADTLSRKEAHRPLDFLRTFRNRIAHHEPIFDRHLEKDYHRILQVADWIAPQKRAWIETHSRVPDLLKTPRDAWPIRF